MTFITWAYAHRGLGYAVLLFVGVLNAIGDAWIIPAREEAEAKARRRRALNTVNRWYERKRRARG